MSFLPSLVSESIERRERNLEAIAGLEGEVGSEAAGEQRSTLRRSQTVGMAGSWGRGWTMLSDSSIYPQSSTKDDPSQNREGARQCDLRYVHLRDLHGGPKSLLFAIQMVYSNISCFKAFAYHREDFCHICEPSAILFV